MKTNDSLVLVAVFILLLFLIIILIALVSYLILTSFPSSSLQNISDTVSIAAWNLENFGTSKAANETLLEFYATTIDDYAVVVLQEIRDPSGTALQSLAKKLPQYSYVLSTPAGQGSSKEQYAIFYSKAVTLVSTTDWTETEQDDFERPPFEATFTLQNWTVTLVTIHAKLNNVPQELTTLERLIGTPSQDTILLGDLNADGDQYYNGVLHHFLDWHWVITSEMDTTVAKSSNAYDRIIINPAAENNFIRSEIMTDVTASQSDHYLISALFNSNEP